MLPLVDKPFVQHLVEYLIVKGITTIDFVLSRYPEQLEELLGDGSRWGAKFSFHPVRDAAQPMKAVRLISLASDEPVLLADADFLPPIAGDVVTAADTPSILWMDGGDSPSCWTGWAVCAAKTLRSLSDASTRSDAFNHLYECGAKRTAAGTVLSVSTFDRLIAAQISVLEGWQDELVVTGSRRTGGIVTGRGARIHPSAEMKGPLYIGEFSEIGEGTKLEPGTIIGRDCVIDTGCRVRESIVLPGTYVGKELDLVKCLADHGVLYNARLGTEVKIADDFLLGRLTPGDTLNASSMIGSRIAAGLILLLLWPLLLLTMLFRATGGRKDAIFRKRMVRLPAKGDPETWGYFDRLYIGDPADPVFSKFGQFLRIDMPGLINVLRGEMHLVGSPSRTKEEIENLDSEWRELYLSSKVGLVTEARVRCGYAPEQDEQHASDTFYAVNASRGYDMKLLGDFVRNQFRPHRS